MKNKTKLLIAVSLALFTMSSALANTPNYVGDIDCSVGLAEDTFTSTFNITNQIKCIALQQQKGKDNITGKYANLVWQIVEQSLLPKVSSKAALEQAISAPVSLNEQCITYPPDSFDVYNKPVWYKNASQLTVTQYPNPVWDQNGNPVRFENYLLDGKLPETAFTSAPGQILQFLSIFDPGVPFISGLDAGKWNFMENESPVLMRVQFAWKQLTENDNQTDFIVNPLNQSEGLAAFHLTVRPQTSGQYWLWATFSQIDNLQGDSPNFFNKHCTDCPVNTCPEKSPDGKYRTQIRRENPISTQIQAINLQKSTQFSKSNLTKVLSKYELVGVQWPAKTVEHNPACGTDGSEECISDYATANKYNGIPPVLNEAPMTNALMEWDRQSANCMACHSRATNWALINNDITLGEYKKLDKLNPSSKFTHCGSQQSDICTTVDGHEFQFTRCFTTAKGSAGCAYNFSPPTDQEYKDNILYYVPASDFLWMFKNVTSVN